MEAITTHLKQVVERLKQKPLSGMELKQAEPLTKHHDLQNLFGLQSHIDSILDRSGKCVIFVPLNREGNIGHWTCACLNGNEFNWFDPYGYPLPFLSAKLNGDHPDITPQNIRAFIQKIRNDGYNVVANRKPYQNRSDDDNKACGRFVILRLALNCLKLKGFDRYITQFKKQYGLKPLDLSVIVSEKTLDR